MQVQHLCGLLSMYAPHLIRQHTTTSPWSGRKSATFDVTTAHVRLITRRGLMWRRQTAPSPLYHSQYCLMPVVNVLHKHTHTQRLNQARLVAWHYWKQWRCYVIDGEVGVLGCDEEVGVLGCDEEVEVLGSGYWLCGHGWPQSRSRRVTVTSNVYGTWIGPDSFQSPFPRRASSSFRDRIIIQSWVSGRCRTLLVHLI